VRKASAMTLVESFRRARAIYYEEGKGALKQLIDQVSILKKAVIEDDSKLFESYKELFEVLTIEAILDGKSEFFHRMELAVKSELLKSSVSSVPEWEDCVFIAFDALYKPGREIQKLDVKNFAKRVRVVNAQRIHGANLFESGPESVEKEIQEAIIKLIEPDWTRIFKRCGLEDLEKNSGGRPEGSKNSLH
jgi:hypothetical protein